MTVILMGIPSSSFSNQHFSILVEFPSSFFSLGISLVSMWWVDILEVALA